MMVALRSRPRIEFAMRLLLYWLAGLLLSAAFFTGIATWFRLSALGGCAASAVFIGAFVAMMADSVPGPDE